VGAGDAIAVLSDAIGGRILPKPLTNRPGQGDALDEFTKRLEGRAHGYQAVHIRLSKLPRGHSWESVRWVAEITFGRLIETYDDEMFRLANGDLVVLCRNRDSDALRQAVGRICALAMIDLTLAHEGADKFAAWYDLSESWDQFMAKVEPLFERKPNSLAASDVADDSRPIDADHLNTLEESLRAVDLSNFVRRQTICAVSGNEPPEPAYEELFISVTDLRDEVMPDVDLAANQLLFRQLTNTFDSRMLSILAANGPAYLGGPCALNLNVATLLSPEFLDLADSFKVGRQQALVVELQMGDVFGNLKDFMLARDVALEIGCRLCLDGIDHIGMPMLDFPQLGFQLYKMQWNPEFVRLPKQKLDELHDAVERAGNERLILCRCDDEAALQFGRQLGISLFQGWHTDKALKMRKKPKQPVAADPA